MLQRRSLLQFIYQATPAGGFTTAQWWSWEGRMAADEVGPPHCPDLQSVWDYTRMEALHPQQEVEKVLIGAL